MPESLIYPSSTPSYFHNMNMNVRDDHAYYMNVADVSYPMISNNPYLIESMIPDDGYTLDLHNDMDIVTENINISHYLIKDPILNADISSLDHTKSCQQRSPVIMVNVGDNPTALVLPNEDMEIDNEVGIFHLLMAYTEAVEMMHDELAKVIIKRISEKVSLAGDTVECLMYYMFQTMDYKQSDYLRQESIKNFYPAFKAFYQIFPNGKFAHFAANSAILEALPDDVEVLRVFDFDIGEGIQWASLIEAIANRGVQVLLTSVKFNDVADSNTMWRFEETKKRLSDYSRFYGFKLKVEEIELYDLEVDLKSYNKTKKGISSEFFVFNCMSCLPHMGRIRSQKETMGFLQMAQDFLKTPEIYSRRGIITLGDGDAVENGKNTATYGGFLDGKMTQYQALLESMKMNFPQHLAEARTAMECLFVAPFVSCNAWAKEWEDRKSGHLPELRLGMEGLNISQQNLMEAKQVVKEGESSYGVRVEGEGFNEMVMDWRGIPLVRFSCWRS